MTSSVPILIPSMGRPFSIGSLYDVHTSQIIPGIKLIRDMMISETDNVSMETDIVTDTSFQENFSDTSVNGNLSLSLLSGAISASGSGNYKNKSSGNKNTETAIYRLKVRSKYCELNLPPGKILKKSDNLCGATHLVVGIQYGGSALFFFERSREDSKSADKTGGGLSAQIGKFASLVSISGSASLDMASEETKEMQKIRVAYKGDFHLASPPTNFVEAMKCIQYIQAAEARSPLLVNLVPLSRLVDETPPIQMPLSITCVSKVIRCYEVLEGALENLVEILAKLRATVWIHLVKKLEAEIRELRAFKASLDDAVQHALQRHASDSQRKEVAAKIALFEQNYPNLLEWANAVFDAGETLVVISDKLREIGAQIIASPAERARFVVGGLTEQDLTLYSLSCPMSAFKLKSFDPKVGIRLWNDKKQETGFYKSLKDLAAKHQTTGGPTRKTNTRIAVEQSETEAVNHGVRMTRENIWEV